MILGSCQAENVFFSNMLYLSDVNNTSRRVKYNAQSQGIFLSLHQHCMVSFTDSEQESLHFFIFSTLLRNLSILC